MTLQVVAGGKGALGQGGSAEGAVTTKSLGFMVAGLAVTLAVRFWALGWKVQWFGDEGESGRDAGRPKSRAS